MRKRIPGENKNIIIIHAYIKKQLEELLKIHVPPREL